MKKLIAIVSCALMVCGVSMSSAAPRKAIKKKTPATKISKPKAVYQAPAQDFEASMRAALGRGYHQQLLRNLFANPEFVERAEVEEFKPLVEKLSGDVTRHEVNGHEILMLRFSNMYDPSDEHVVLYDPERDNFVRGFVYQGGDKQKGGYYKVEFDENRVGDIDNEELQRLYDETF